MCENGRHTFQSGTFVPRNRFNPRGEKRQWPMPRLSYNPDADFSTGASDEKLAVDIAELFAARPLGVDEAFADSSVQMRIGNLIAQAMDRRTKPRP